MRILDWRSPAERLLTSLWRPSVAGADCAPGPVGRLYNGLHDRVLGRRVRGRQAPVSGPLVVSIGNLALGGTGKTPIAIAVARDLAERGIVGCVLTRGFRSPLAGPLVVAADNEQAGDEARLLASALAPVGWQVVQSRRRASGLRYLLQGQVKPQIVLLEDGHQTAEIGRHCDTVILDHWRVKQVATEDVLVPITGPVFPLGAWRESAVGAARADIWVVETDALLPQRGIGGSRVVTFSRVLSLQPVNRAALAAERVGTAGLVSGIARPAGFESGAQGLIATAARVAVRLPDHAPYQPVLVARLGRALVDAEANCLITTAKDWVKLAGNWPDSVPAYVVALDIVWGQGETLPDLIGERLNAWSGRTSRSRK